MASTAQRRPRLRLVTDNTCTCQMGDRIVRIGEVCELTGLSRTTIWRRIDDGSFPPSIPLGPEGTRARGWRLSDIQAWIDALPTAA
ncbi:MAG: AlpA family transcriptional regulator [bacterium]|nr:AlpA family transcriptional regulator [bacterium]MDE0288306.1 AlpA family transcriptional regulator [bacterium]MDE0437096.1 AlpA family transcriptional regulator [bacterium]